MKLFKFSIDYSSWGESYSGNITLMNPDTRQQAAVQLTDKDCRDLIKNFEYNINNTFQNLSKVDWGNNLEMAQPNKGQDNGTQDGDSADFQAEGENAAEV